MRPFMLTAALAAALFAAPAAAQTRVTLKSATSTSSYYVMIVQIGEALKDATQGKIQATIEESQGSVQNLKEAIRRPGNFIFTTPPSLLADAKAGKKPFEGESGYDNVRALFVMPYVTVHFVTRADAGVSSLSDLKGKQIIAGGRGTFCDGRTKSILKALGLEDQVTSVDVELASAPSAMRDKKVAAFTTCSSHPTPMVQELATSVDLRLVSFKPEELDTVLKVDPGFAPLTIAGGTYRGIDQDTQTVGGPVGAFTTAAMDEETAYQVTKAFWTRRDAMAAKNPWWKGIDPKMVAQLGTRLHPGALRYYAEAGIAIPDAMK